MTILQMAHNLFSHSSLRSAHRARHQTVRVLTRSVLWEAGTAVSPISQRNGVACPGSHGKEVA